MGEATRKPLSSNKPRPGCFIGEDWKERVLPIFILPDDHFEHCPTHGDWCVNAYYDVFEVAEMLATDTMECPICLAEICGGR